MMWIKNLFHFIFPSSVLLIVIFSRFKKLTLTKTFLTFNVVFLIIIVLFFMILIIVTIIKINKQKNKTIFAKVFINNILENLNNFYYLPLGKIDKFLANKYFIYFKKDRVDFINKHLNSFYTKKLKPKKYSVLNRPFIVYFLLKYIPKIFVAFIFLLDVFYFQQFYYVYWVLPLLIIPLVLQYLKYIYFLDYKQFIVTLNNDINILDNIPPTPDNLVPLLDINTYLEKSIDYRLKNVSNPYKNQIVFTYSYFGRYLEKLRPEQRRLPVNYDALTKKYIRFLEWIEKVHLIHYLLIKTETRLDLLINLLVFSCYFIGWAYILIFFFIDITFLENLIDLKDPFSEIPIR